MIGSAGYVGPPSPDGTVEVGYGIVADRRREGYATEVVRGMVAHAFAAPEVIRFQLTRAAYEAAAGAR